MVLLIVFKHKIITISTWFILSKENYWCEIITQKNPLLAMWVPLSLSFFLSLNPSEVRQPETASKDLMWSMRLGKGNRYFAWASSFWTLPHIFSPWGSLGHCPEQRQVKVSAKFKLIIYHQVPMWIDCFSVICIV